MAVVRDYSKFRPGARAWALASEALAIHACAPGITRKGLMREVVRGIVHHVRSQFIAAHAGDPLARRAGRDRAARGAMLRAGAVLIRSLSRKIHPHHRRVFPR